MKRVAILSAIVAMVLCVQALIRHRLAAPVWLGQWLAIKRERWAARNELLLTVEEELKSVQQGLGGDSENRAEDGTVPGAPQG